MNSATQMLAAFREMSAHKYISREEVYDLIKDGILAALAKRYGPNVEAEVEIDETTGKIGITVLKVVVAEVEDPSREISLDEARGDDPEFEVGDILELPVEFAHFGHKAVLAAKQRILQRVRERERQKLRDEYKHRVGELLSGEVQQVQRGKLVLMLDSSRDTNAIIPWKEQNPRERFRQGEPIRSVLKKVEETPKGPRLILSRADPLFVAALFKLEVPEIQEGIVEIRGAAREVGFRSKIAVSSRDESVDPVGACVGLKGSRVRAVVQELGGERIDIIPWHPDPEIYAKRALAPARVAKVLSDYETRTITAIVDEDQLSLAIGRDGQNVRLASQLIGWQLDLFGSREWLELGAERALFGGGDESELESTDFSLRDLDLAPATLAALEAAGYRTSYDVIDLEREDLLRIPGLGADEADRLRAEIEPRTVVESDEHRKVHVWADSHSDPDAPFPWLRLAVSIGPTPKAGQIPLPPPEWGKHDVLDLLITVFGDGLDVHPDCQRVQLQREWPLEPVFFIIIPSSGGQVSASVRVFWVDEMLFLQDIRVELSVSNAAEAV